MFKALKKYWEKSLSILYFTSGIVGSICFFLFSFLSVSSLLIFITISAGIMILTAFTAGVIYIFDTIMQSLQNKNKNKYTYKMPEIYPLAHEEIEYAPHLEGPTTLIEISTEHSSLWMSNELSLLKEEDVPRVFSPRNS